MPKIFTRKWIKKNDAFQVVLPNCLELLILFLAAGKGGFNIMPCSQESTRHRTYSF